jgi:glycosyltransferase involved in cell wall biosynthesis
MLFVAGFGHPPNVDAAIWLVGTILPLIHEKRPGYHLTLVGSNPTEEVKRLASEHVTVTGYVTDDALMAWYQKSRVAVVPLRFGAGVKRKVVEALQFGVPLVTTTIGAQGLAALEDVAVISDTPQSIADAIVAFIGDDARWNIAVAAGKHYFSQNFSRDEMRKVFEQDIDASPRRVVRDAKKHSIL